MSAVMQNAHMQGPVDVCAQADVVARTWGVPSCSGIWMHMFVVGGARPVAF